jgi:hypothetical protein
MRAEPTLVHTQFDNYKKCFVAARFICYNLKKCASQATATKKSTEQQLQKNSFSLFFCKNATGAIRNY